MCIEAPGLVPGTERSQMVGYLREWTLPSVVLTGKVKELDTFIKHSFIQRLSNAAMRRLRTQD